MTATTMATTMAMATSRSSSITPFVCNGKTMMHRPVAAIRRSRGLPLCERRRGTRIPDSVNAKVPQNHL